LIKSASTVLFDSITSLQTNKIASEVATAQTCEFLTLAEQSDFGLAPTHSFMDRKLAIILRFFSCAYDLMLELLGTAIAKSFRRQENFSGLKRRNEHVELLQSTTCVGRSDHRVS
jgi:hypothetical protein